MMMKNVLFTVFSFINVFVNAVNAQSTGSREGVTIPTLEVTLYARAMNGTMFLADGILQNFNNNYSAAVDNMDVRKFMNATDNLSIKNGNYNLFIERRPDISVTDTLRLILSKTRVAPYRFDIDPSVLNYPNIRAYLLDKFLKSETLLSFNNVTSVSFDITADPLSRVVDRFMIVYRLQPPVRFTELTAFRNPDNSVSTRFKTENENNVNYYSIEKSTDSIYFSKVATQMPTANNFGNPYYNYVDADANADFNWYRIKETSINGRTSYSMVAKVDKVFKKSNGSVNVFPNPIINGEINIIFENTSYGNYTLSLLNDAGQLMNFQKVALQTTTLKKSMFVPELTKGIYRLIITDNKGQKKVLSLYVK